MSFFGRRFLGGYSLIAVTGALTSSAMAAGRHCGWDSAFCFHGAPAPVAGAGLPVLAAIGIAFLLVRRFRRKAQ